jgi:hypothetical protein
MMTTNDISQGKAEEILVHKDAFVVEPFRLFRSDDPVVQRLALASLRPVGQRAQVTRRRDGS